ncbi:hypothetical protein SAMD00019534_072670 [Acytostelium subglobosum LB1]|uniref:hypothetical protein n=1 Tax=Acytostelium subglobosum LB1 TaxID=1410327 RepID=UPI00064517BF|nr:hypothetical protein SAMD00019534_072670 [Acytostelium subglobosum LB1]GAM24092.1 hypothetical protein SAMD00019534_072670 [Acytostelium subglobosum LB1]|eukprot:XP_012753128.1 hypothetical protein SAMD00019534_072670 [Acytostelium subglobosum LB1]
MNIQERLKAFASTVLPASILLVVGIIGNVFWLLLLPLFYIVGQVKGKTFAPPKTIIITGAGSGIGRQFAVAYAETGKTLGLMDVNEANLEETAKLCTSKGAKVEKAVIDVTNETAMDTWMKKIDQKTPVDLVIANAGVAEFNTSRDLTFDQMTRKVLDININGVVNTVIPLLESMRERRNGQIVFLGSLSHYIPYFCPSYVGSKGFSFNYAAALRQDVRKYGIGVTYLCPGFIDTRLTRADPKLYTPGMKKVEESVAIFKQGISENRSFVTDNSLTMNITYFLSCLPMTLRDGFDIISRPVLKTGVEDSYEFCSSHKKSK